jgi:predicted TIM-barrel fold metal-dependent hydrolase
MQELACPPELMLAQMTVAGVDHCILQAGGGYGAMNDMNAFAQRQHPGKFSGLLHVDEATADQAGTLAEVGRAVDTLGLRGLYYAQDFSRHGYARNVDHDDYRPFWELVVERRLPVFIELSSTPGYDRAGYLANLAALDRLLARHPSHRFLLVMGPPVGHFAPGGTWDFPPEVLATYQRENLLLEIMFPITWGGVWDYPYPEAQALVRGMRDRFGASKLVWGSDMPNVERSCTYGQTLTYLTRHCEFLPAADLDLILGENANELYFGR